MSMLRKVSLLVSSFLLLAAGWLMPARASAEVNVVTTVPVLADLVRQVGGSYVSVHSLAPANQDPHYVDARPSFVLALHRADLLVYVGLGLEVGWLPTLLADARNADIQPGRPGHLDASTVCGPILGKPDGRVDRSRGDLHPSGNPHYLLDPRYGLRVADAIAQRLAMLDPEHAQAYRSAYQAFAQRMRRRIAAWEHTMAPFRGQPIVGYHESLVYLAHWLGLKEAGFVEPLPGISPSPRHLAQLILSMRRQHVRVLLSEPWYDMETARTVAAKSGATLVRLPGGVGSPGIRDYEGYIDAVVRGLSKAFGASA